MRQTTELFLSLAFWLDLVPFCVGMAYAAIRAVATGDKLSRAEAKRRFAEMSEGVVRRGKPSRKIVKSKEV